MLFRSLVEPRRWDKRHIKTCPYYDPSAAVDVPPYRVSVGVNFPFWTGGVSRPEYVNQEGDVMYYFEECDDVCLRRQGLALLGTNKQVHEEASPMFWKNATFCFDKAEEVFNKNIPLPDSALSKIRKFSLVIPRGIKRGEMVADYETWNSTSLPWHTRWALIGLLKEMSNLVELELSAECSRFFQVST